MTNLKIFYSPKQTVRDNTSFSPSAGKPEHVVNQFQKTGRVDVRSGWMPLTQDDISIAHDAKFVDDILKLRRSNGFNNKLPSVAASLPYTAGSFFRAAEYALENKTVAMSPTSGFHHSGYDSCHGFCTFNGLMIAAFLLWRDYAVSKIGIIDFDAHYGDGTADIISSVEGASDVIEHLTFGAFAKNGMNFNLWLDRLEADLIERFNECDILFYQAGADPHINDPLGGFLTTEQMKRRDEIVFKVAKKLNKPIVWNLAGGYQNPLQKVLDIHNNTLQACLEHYVDAT
jgi:acetoin utilization deacetylase AcuC-like enzyme